jgi:hypothetical protein
MPAISSGRPSRLVSTMAAGNTTPNSALPPKNTAIDTTMVSAQPIASLAAEIRVITRKWRPGVPT